MQTWGAQSEHSHVTTAVSGLTVFINVVVVQSLHTTVVYSFSSAVLMLI